MPEHAPAPAVPEQPNGHGGRSQTNHLLDIAVASADFFHTDDERAFAVVVDHDDIRKVLLVGSAGFRAWLARLYELAHGQSARMSNLREAAEHVALQAVHAFPRAEAAVRIGGNREEVAVYVDLGTDDWTAVRVTAVGWSIVEHPEVPRLYRPRVMQPLPLPLRGGDLNALRSFINVGNDDDFRLVIAWLLMSLRPTGPYPVLPLVGGAGSAKSTTARVLKLLVDPTEPPTLSLPKGEEDFWVSATRRHIIALDNVSWLPDWASDALCKVATGGGFGKRSLYTNDDEHVLSATRPVCINGITNFVARGDLADRSILIELPPIAEYEEEAVFWRRFEEARPKLFGALLDALSATLRAHPLVQLPRRNIRMADFARWGLAVEHALGWPEGSFIQAYERNRKVTRSALLESSTIAQALMRIVEQGTFTGGATELLKRMRDVLDLDEQQAKDFPRSPRGVTSHLQRLRPTLAAEGIDITWVEERNRVYTIRRAAAPLAEEA